MKSTLFPCVVAILLLGDAAAFAASARSPRSSAPNQRPAVQIDRTPVSEGRPAVVTSYADVVEPVQKAVVSIYSTKIVRERFAVNPLLRQFGFQDQERESKQEGMGSGVIVTADGYILTNNHVVEGADELKVSLTDDREFLAKVIGTDPKTDVAVIKIDAEKLPTVTLADSEKLRVGDVVFAVGNPLNVGQTVTMGIVSAKGRNKVHILDEVQGYENFIQTDAAINMGNSGGALIDAKGRLVGINAAILSPSRGNIGIGFAIPINLAASIMNSLVETGTVQRGALGVFADPNPLTADVAEQLGLAKDTKGVLVTDITPKSAAEKAGIKRTDVILAIDGRAVSSFEELRLLVSQLLPGTVVKLKIVRDGKERIIEATLDKLADNPNELLPGVTVGAIDNAARRRLGLNNRVAGLLITEVAADSPHRDSLVADMVILEINRVAVGDVAAAKEALRPGRNLLAIFYGGGIRFTSVTLK
ncbi:MAG: Do family serine endopeptidase [Verrucomicrobia bacterium]|nr:Do family serine endopeptidase [Verrucomicrobiota bacterium]